MNPVKPRKMGENGRKLQPQLRMLANCSSNVNAHRAAQSGAVAVIQREHVELPRRAELEAAAFDAPVGPVADPAPLEQISDDVLVNVFIETTDLAEKLSVKDTVEASVTVDVERGRTRTGVTAHRGNLATATVRLSQLKDLADQQGVTYVEAAQRLVQPTPTISSDATVTPATSPRKLGEADTHRDGQGVLIGIVDVQGFDFSHPDFLVEGRTRFVRIWDQGGTNRPNPHQRVNAAEQSRFGRQFDFGSEIREDEMNTALAAAAQAGVPAYELEPQSRMDPRSHGTHVASIAAGNAGICRKSKIAAVLIALSDEDSERRRSFYDSTRIVHAVNYLFALGQELGLPVSINISLGTNGHAHDASSAVSRWLDSAVSMPGRCVCVAAGNSGQEAAASPGDLGWVMGRIHTSGQIPARDLTADIEWEVVGNGRVDFSENELEIWYAAQDRFAVQVRPPGGEWIGPIEPLTFVENKLLRDENDQLLCVLSVYNDLYNPANGSNYIAVYLTPFFEEPLTGIASGRWTVRLIGLDIRDGRFDGWIERDDPRRLGPHGSLEAWRFPSYFSDRSNVNRSSVSSLACGQRIVSVANLDVARERIHESSSQGPTRDSRFKPDVAAPGTDIVAAYGFGGADQPWVKMTGTSMASPYVAGVAGLMLAIEPRLTAAQIEAIIHRTSQPLPGANFTWLNDAGFGRIAPEACLREAALAYKRKEVQL